MRQLFDFDEIRPFYDEEIPDIIRSLTKEEKFRHTLKFVVPDVDAFCRQMEECTTKREFQKRLAIPVLNDLARRSTSGVDASGLENLSPSGNYTYMSNHRDIVLDASFLNMMLDAHGFETSEVAIGDNLLVYPWISDLVRVNKSVIVNRNVPRRRMLEVSRRLSNYINFAIKIKHQSLWIAQREGRSKNSEDQTQESVIKMLNLGGGSDMRTNIMGLNIVPVSISYEYDPCDYLKAKEYQMKRDNPDYKKQPQDDLFSMETGISGYKGHIHFHLSPVINGELEKLEDCCEKSDVLHCITRIIDKAIHSNYMIYSGNYVAYDELYHTDRFSRNYSTEEKRRFMDYMQKQLDKIDLPQKDEAFLLERMLEMYSNPLKNKLIATGVDL